MKIGILTFHEIYNPGAFLQTIATQRLVEKLGYRAEVINYNPPLHRYSAYRQVKAIGFRSPFFVRYLVDCWIKNRIFRKARARHMTMSRYFETRNEICEEAYDAVLVGADIVWNFKLQYLGQDPVYFGEGIRTKNLIAFAPSCGSCTVDDCVPEYVRQGLMRFDAISVRDPTSARIVRQLTGGNPLVICDPTFHLDLDGMPEGEVKIPKGKKYILVYIIPSLVSRELTQYILLLKRLENIPIYSIYYRHNWADCNIMNADPFAWVRIIKEAEFVITNTFHGTIFSFLQRKNFIVEMNEAIRSKTQEMLIASGLADRIFNPRHPRGLEIRSEIDYGNVGRFIEKERLKAERYLISALGDNGT